MKTKNQTLDSTFNLNLKEKAKQLKKANYEYSSRCLGLVPLHLSPSRHNNPLTLKEMAELQDNRDKIEREYFELAKKFYSQESCN